MNLEFFGELLRWLEAPLSRFELPGEVAVLVGVLAGLTLALVLLSAVALRRQLARRRTRRLRDAEGRRRVHLYQADARHEPYLGTDPQGSVPRERRAASGR